MTKAQILINGIQHFEELLKDHLGTPQGTAHLRVVQADHVCDVEISPNVVFQNDSNYALKQSLAPDVLRVHSSAGATSEATRNAGPGGQQHLSIFENAIVYQEVYVDTVFERAVTHVVRSFNGMLRLRCSLHPGPRKQDLAKQFNLPPNSPEPKRLPGQGDAIYRKNQERWRAWWDHKPKNGVSPREKHYFLEDIAAQIKVSHAAHIAEALKVDPVLRHVQQEIWGQSDPEPTLWYERTEETSLSV